MPEGPEIRTLGRQLRPLIVGQTITEINADANRAAHVKLLGQAKAQGAIGAKVLDVSTHGKRLSWLLSNGKYFNFSFGMTGSFSTQPGSHNRLIFYFANDTCIYYDDIRCFGKVTFNDIDTGLMGVDPFGTGYTIPLFNNLLELNKKKRLAEYLLDQSYIAGIGNYLRAEILYRAKLNPWRTCESLTNQEKHTLYVTIEQLMVESYDCGGCTLATYKNVQGNPGTFAEKLVVYKKKKDPFGNKVVRELDKTKRAMWWVPTVQK